MAVQPNAGLVRLMRVTTDLRHSTSHPVALEVLLRAAAIVLASMVILGLLPAIAEAAG